MYSANLPCGTLPPKLGVEPGGIGHLGGGEERPGREVLLAFIASWRLARSTSDMVSEWIS